MSCFYGGTKNRKKMAESDEKLKELEEENGSLKTTNEQLK